MSIYEAWDDVVLGIEEYIARREKEDRLSELDVDSDELLATQYEMKYKKVLKS